MKRFVTRRLIAVLCAAGTLGFTAQAMASAFQLWEQDGASIGLYHAGYAAAAEDASTGFYNPAGLTRFDHQQVVFGADAVMSNFKYRGSLTLETPLLQSSQTYNDIVAQGGQFGVIPDLHYVAPINDWLVFGFDVTVPFGLETNYGLDTPLQYAGTLSAITVVDISPSLGFKVTDKASLGAGFDIQRAYAEFNQVASIASGNVSDFNTTSTNKANDTGYGYHLGALYEFTPDTRVGLSYHSQVVHHLTGSSHFVGPLANIFNNPDNNPYVNNPIISHYAIANITLPAYTALSGYHKITPQVALLASAIYTQWNTFQTLKLQNVAGVSSDFTPTNSINVVIPQHYSNTWNFSVGTEYYITTDATLRAGVGYDQSPVKDAYRNIQLPDNDRFVIALGGHYQATKAVGFDLGWSHFFINQASVNPPPQVVSSETVYTNGSVTGGADVIGGQVVWDIT